MNSSDSFEKILTSLSDDGSTTDINVVGREESIRGTIIDIGEDYIKVKPEGPTGGRVYFVRFDAITYVDAVEPAQSDGNMPFPDGQEDKLFSDRREDRPLSNRREDRPLSDRREDRPLSDRREDRPLSDRRGDRPLSDRREDKPLSDRREDKPLSDRREEDRYRRRRKPL